MPAAAVEEETTSLVTPPVKDAPQNGLIVHDVLTPQPGWALPVSALSGRDRFVFPAGIRRLAEPGMAERPLGRARPRTMRGRATRRRPPVAAAAPVPLALVVSGRALTTAPGTRGARDTRGTGRALAARSRLTSSALSSRHAPRGNVPSFSGP